MKTFATAAVAATLAGAVSAHAPIYSAGKTCQNITVPVSISARNAVFDQQKLTPKDNIDVTNFILNNARQGHNYTQEQLLNYTTFSGHYNLSTTYCAPSHGAADTVQLLTHGIGFDRSYWDFSYNNYNYSYVEKAVEYGFATFSHDRLGVGMSSHGEPVNEIQVALEVAALKALTDKLRAGEIPGVPGFKKVLHIGHSFGSVQSYALSAMYPEITDGLGLTGFSQNGTFLPFFQLGGGFTQANLNPALSAFPNGYLAPATASAVQTNFFAEGDFDPKVLEVATMTGQPVTIGELLTIGGATGSKNPTKAPVLIITGEKDIPFCGGDCLAAPTGFNSIPETSKAMFPNTADFKVGIVPGAGHGLNLQYTHGSTYATILEFFKSNGLAPRAYKPRRV